MNSKKEAGLWQVWNWSCTVPILQAETYKVMVIEVPIESPNLVHDVALSEHPAGWNGRQFYPRLQEIGSHWYENNQSLVLKVPSALIPQEHNFVINSKHELFHTQAKLIGVEDFFWDQRLL